jgi:hypothetical protein
MNASSSAVSEVLSSESNLSCHCCNSERSALRYSLDGLCNLSGSIGSIVCALLLDVQIFGVLSYNNHINWFGRSHNTLHRSDVRVQVETLTEGNNWGRVALDSCGGGADGSEESTITFLLEGLDGPLWKGSTGLLKGLKTSLEIGKREFEVEGGGEGFEDATSGGNNFSADSVTGDETWRKSEELAL